MLMHRPPQDDGAAGTVEIGQLGQFLRRRWTWPLVLALVFMLITLIAVSQMEPRYEARAVVIAKVEQNQPSFRLGGPLSSSLLSDFTRSETLSTYDKFVALIASEDVAQAIAARPALMARLFPDNWDPATRRWLEPGGLVAALRRIFHSSLGLPGWRQPGIEPVLDFLTDRTRVRSNDNGRFYAISFRHADPAVAMEALRAIMAAADDLLRARDRASANDNIRFLRGRLAAEPLAEVRDVLSNRLGQEYARATTIATTGSYAYDLFRAPYVTARPVTPRPLLSLLVAGLAGLIVGTVAAILVPVARRAAAPVDG